MDEFDYENYGMEYGEYNTPESKGSSSDGSSAEAENLEVTLTVAVAESRDSRRIVELDLGNHDFPDQSKYPQSSSRKVFSDHIPVAVIPDHRRISIHPLGITGKPAGVSKSLWDGMGADRLSTSFKNSPVKPIGKDVGGQEEKKAGVKPEAVTSSGGSGGGATTDDNEEEKEYDPTEMPFLDHLEEFRWALLKSIIAIVISMMASWFLSDIFYSTITRLAKDAELELISTKLMEGIMMKLQMTLVMGLFLALPFLFYFLWSFVSPGLYKKERKWILPLVFAATICFFIGASIAYFIIIPFILPFIKAFLPGDIRQMITIGDFIAKMLKFTLLFGIIFELPMVAYFLAKIGILKHTFMTRYRRYAIVAIFILGAIFTPPDPISQIMMALPLILLYEVSIYVARFAGRKTIL